MQKLSRLHCLQNYWLSFPPIIISIVMFRYCLSFWLNHFNTVYSKKCPLTPNSWNFSELLSIVTTFSFENYALFRRSFWTENQTPQTLSIFWTYGASSQQELLSELKNKTHFTYQGNQALWISYIILNDCHTGLYQYPLSMFSTILNTVTFQNSISKLLLKVPKLTD